MCGYYHVIQRVHIQLVRGAEQFRAQLDLRMTSGCGLADIIADLSIIKPLYDHAILSQGAVGLPGLIIDCIVCCVGVDHVHAVF